MWSSLFSYAFVLFESVLHVGGLSINSFAFGFCCYIRISKRSALVHPINDRCRWLVKSCSLMAASGFHCLTCNLINIFAEHCNVFGNYIFLLLVVQREKQYFSCSFSFGQQIYSHITAYEFLFYCMNKCLLNQKIVKKKIVSRTVSPTFEHHIIKIWNLLSELFNWHPSKTSKGTIMLHCYRKKICNWLA